MSIFEELQVAYRASQETYREYARNSLLAAHQLAHDFREDIGAPETYADPEDETRRPYVRLLSFQLPEGVPVAVQPESHADLMTREPDGLWRFAGALTVPRDAESLPRQPLASFRRLRVEDGVGDVRLLDEVVHDSPA